MAVTRIGAEKFNATASIADGLLTADLASKDFVAGFELVENGPPPGPVREPFAIRPHSVRLRQSADLYFNLCVAESVEACTA
jgi:hypothetical protein